MTAVLYIILSILCLIGLATVIRGIAFAVFKCNWKARLCHVLLLDNEHPEIVIRDAVEQINWNNLTNSNGLFALDIGMNEKVKEEATLILRDYNIPLTDINEIGKVLKNS